MEPLNSISDLKYIPLPIPLDKNSKINEQAQKCIFKIENEGDKGTAFICQIPYNNKKILVLITNKNLVNESLIKNNKYIKVIVNDNEEKKIKIKINEDKKIFINESQDISIIEIEPDSDLNFLEFDETIFNEDNSMIKNENIYTIHYISYDNVQKASVSYGFLNEISNNNMNYLCRTGEGSLGSPILRLSSNKVIGINTKNNSGLSKNNGYFLKDVIKEYISDNDDMNKIIICENEKKGNLNVINKNTNSTVYGPETLENEQNSIYYGPETGEENLKESITYLGPETGRNNDEDNKELSENEKKDDILSNSNDIKPLNMQEIGSTYSQLNSNSNNSNNNSFNYNSKNSNEISNFNNNINLEKTLSKNNCFFVNNNNNNNINNNNMINNYYSNNVNINKNNDSNNVFNSLTIIELQKSLNPTIKNNNFKKKEFSFSRYTKASKIIIKNLGNTSYLSSTLHLLGNNDSLIKYFLNPKNDHKNSQTINLSYIFQNLYNILYPYPEKGNLEVYDPLFIFNQFVNFNLIYSKTEQNPNNLIFNILQHLHKELLINKENPNININVYDRNSVILNNIKNLERSKIVDIFNWFEIREFICKCNYIRYSLFSNNCFLLDILGCYHQNKKEKNYITIEDCIRYQTFGRKSDMCCNGCKANYYTESKIYSTAEKILFLLDRNNFNQNLLNIHFKVEDKLDLTNYIESEFSPKKYELTGIVSIPANNPMYVTFCKSPIDEEWYYYSNEEIIHKELNDVIKENNSIFIPSILIYNSIK